MCVSRGAPFPGQPKDGEAHVYPKNPRVHSWSKFRVFARSIPRSNPPPNHFPSSPAQSVTESTDSSQPLDDAQNNTSRSSWVSPHVHAQPLTRKRKFKLREVKSRLCLFCARKYLVGPAGHPM
ncbi:hypothetical protein OIU79_008187 [Salix purpurea]|uniref:Uncharacterized protein n=1 Tax=Salix purpurea TaxID=77065 RepID=A0A9Q0YVY0_SALPP|nr:hypothetical protein OIU79_008187 [Salix purpurea]